MSLKEIVLASGGVARPGPRVEDALRRVSALSNKASPAQVLICGSPYLAGEVLKQGGPLLS